MTKKELMERLRRDRLTMGYGLGISAREKLMEDVVALLWPLVKAVGPDHKALEHLNGS